MDFHRHPENLSYFQSNSYQLHTSRLHVSYDNKTENSLMR
jgi:hypothetical protein